MRVFPIRPMRGLRLVSREIIGCLLTLPNLVNYHLKHYELVKDMSECINEDRDVHQSMRALRPVATSFEEENIY